MCGAWTCDFASHVTDMSGEVAFQYDWCADCEFEMFYVKNENRGKSNAF